MLELIERFKKAHVTVVNHMSEIANLSCTVSQCFESRMDKTRHRSLVKKVQIYYKEKK